MDLLASIFAYLGTVAAILIAIAMSYDVVVYKPLNAPPALYAASAPTKASTARAPKPALTHKAKLAADEAWSHRGAPRMGAWRRLSAAERHPSHLVRGRRQLAREARARPKHWAYRPVPQGPYALGYAEDSRQPFGERGFE